MRKIFVFLIAIAFTSPLLSQTILVVGGAGFIGSHVNQRLVQSGYQTIVLDNLSRGDERNVKSSLFIEGDIQDTALLDRIFTTYPIDAVMHFAASLEVGESVVEPLKYYKNNVSGTLNLLEAMLRHQVHIFVFSSSATVYGIPQESLLTETHPCLPINPYGQTKWMIETVLGDLDRAYNFRFCTLRYFNATGGDPEGILKNYKTKEPNLIPIALRRLQEPGKPLTLFGTDYPTPDGTPIRDYIHVEDLASAHIAAMENLFHGAPSTVYNLGCGRGFSVREVIAAIEKVTGQKIPLIAGPRRTGDPPVLVANIEKAQRELDWHPRYLSLEEMIEHAWLALQR